MDPTGNAQLKRPDHTARIAIALLIGACILLSSCRSPGANAAPSIEFTKVPQAAEGGPDKVESIEGRVIGARSGQRIVLFARSGVRHGQWGRALEWD